jgi:nucleoid-associated protein YgaU
MPIRVGSYSRLRFADLGSADGVEFWTLPDFPIISEQVDDLSYQVQGGDRLDRLANRFYGDPVLWWVLAVSNGMEILPTELNEGDFIRIPSPRYVTQELFKTAGGR